MQEIFENDGVVSYFEQTAEWTLNAVLQDDGMISIAKTQKRQKGVVYTAICDGKELLKNEKAVYDVEMWELVCLLLPALQGSSVLSLRLIPCVGLLLALYLLHLQRAAADAAHIPVD